MTTSGLVSQYIISVLFLLFLALLVACDDGSDVTTPTATVSASASQPNALCPVVQQACAAASSLLTILDSGETNDLVARLHQQDYTCPGRPQQFADEPFPLCDGVGVGEVRKGIRVVGSSASFVMSPEQFFARALPLEAGSHWSVRTLGCGPSAAPVNACADDVAVVISTLERPDYHLILTLSPVGLAWKITKVVSGITFVGAIDEIVVRGGKVPLGSTHGAIDGIEEFFPW